jgi:hypothetical protein
VLAWVLGFRYFIKWWRRRWNNHNHPEKSDAFFELPFVVGSPSEGNENSEMAKRNTLATKIGR